MKLEKFKKQSIADKNILSAIKGGANGMSVNNVSRKQSFTSSTCEDDCQDYYTENYEDGKLYGTSFAKSRTLDCIYG